MMFKHKLVICSFNTGIVDMPGCQYKHIPTRNTISRSTITKSGAQRPKDKEKCILRIVGLSISIHQRKIKKYKEQVKTNKDRNNKNDEKARTNK
tara:strand:+ start:1583 stop:1864 length:282 start_codon:yes stop_codon:yes gene_type:complete